MSGNEDIKSNIIHFSELCQEGVMFAGMSRNTADGVGFSMEVYFYVYSIKLIVGIIH